MKNNKIVDYKNLKDVADFEISKSGKTAFVWWNNELGLGQMKSDVLRVKDFDNGFAHVETKDAIGRITVYFI